MSIERVLSLDISTKTGWALLVSGPDGFVLEEYGQVPKITEPEGKYPDNYVFWAYQCFGKIIELIDRLTPDCLVIEETSGGSKSGMSQKILEFLHFLVAKMISETGIKSTYMLTEEWRRIVGCVMTAAEKKKNKEVREYKKEHNNTRVAYDIKGKRIGLTGRKHVNIRRTNEIFKDFLAKPLIRSQEDTCDGILLSYAYHLRRMKEKEKHE